MHRDIEVLRDHFTPNQVLDIRAEAKREGCKVNVMRTMSGMVEIEIIKPDKVIDITPNRQYLN